MNPALIQLADSLFSKLARVSRANATGAVECICCGHSFHWGNTDCAHFITRGHMALRYELDNCWPVCRLCHTGPFHQVEYEAALVEKKGQAFVDSLRERGYQYTRSRTDHEMAALIEEINQKLLAL